MRDHLSGDMHSCVRAHLTIFLSHGVSFGGSHVRPLEMCRVLQHLLNLAQSHKDFLLLNQRPRCSIATPRGANENPPERLRYFRQTPRNTTD
eukprot:IDg10534t1